MRKITVVILMMVLVLCSCNSGVPDVADLQSRITALEQENKDLRVQLEKASDNTIASIPNSSSGNESSQSSSIKSNEDKFKGISVTVTEKNIVEQGGYYEEFIELVLVVENNTSKDIKGIEGGMRITDMFGKAIMNIGWDVLEPIAANSSETFKGNGINYRATIAKDNEKKLYSTNYDSLIFEYEFKTVMFADGSTIS